MNRRSPLRFGLTSLLALLQVLLLAAAARAHQPVMDMAPRWQDGLGFQLRHESRSSNTLLTGGQRTANPHGRSRKVETLWLEGVYTLRREFRVTLKVPWVEQRRVAMVDGAPTLQRGRGLGDIILAAPLRRYQNLDASTFNFGVTPQLRLPTGSTRAAYPVGDGSLDPGLSASFTWEDPFYYAYADLFYWRNGSGSRGMNRGDETGLDLNFGIHPLHHAPSGSGLFLMLDIEARHEGRGRDTVGATGGRRLTLGPVLVAYRQNLMLRVEWKLPVYERVFDTQVSRGPQLHLGIGIAF